MVWHTISRAAEYVGIFNLTGKHLKSPEQPALSDQLFEYNVQ